jgi:hypothetical protein
MMEVELMKWEYKEADKQIMRGGRADEVRIQRG